MRLRAGLPTTILPCSQEATIETGHGAMASSSSLIDATNGQADTVDENSCGTVIEELPFGQIKIRAPTRRPCESLALMPEINMGIRSREEKHK
jgi:hypothetical protein